MLPSQGIDHMLQSLLRVLDFRSVGVNIRLGLENSKLIISSRRELFIFNKIKRIWHLTVINMVTVRMLYYYVMFTSFVSLIHEVGAMP